VITVHIIILLAIVMAIFGIIGYHRGVWPEVVSLVVLIAAFTLVEKRPEQLIDLLNGLFMGVMLAIKSGLYDLSTGNLEEAKRKLEAIEKPFVGRYEGFALVVVMVVAALVGYLLGRWIKSRKSALGAALGILNGYVLCAAFLPWLSRLPKSALPLPPIRKGEGLTIEAGRRAGQVAAKLAPPPVAEWLKFKGGLPLIILMALLFILAVWLMRPRRA